MRSHGNLNPTNLATTIDGVNPGERGSRGRPRFRHCDVEPNVVCVRRHVEGSSPRLHVTGRRYVNDASAVRRGRQSDAQKRSHLAIWGVDAWL